jgi:tRNA dimethylallyltransferase
MTSKSKSPIFVLGPTAVGKTTISIDLALKIKGEIVSADSMQIYKGMDIGTAKPTVEERKGVAHHLFDVLDICEHCDVARFKTLAQNAITEIQLRGAVPIIVGGSGMYVRALTQGLFEGPGRDESIRKELDALETLELRRLLEEADPISAQKIGENDRRRMIRALEFFRLTKKPISQFQNQWNLPDGKKSQIKQNLFCLNRSRDELYERCNQRVDVMFEKGFIDEVRELLKQGLGESPTASKAIGYAEVIQHLQGEVDLSQTIETVKRKTRNFVKRQLSWFRREVDLKWLDLSSIREEGLVVSKIVEFL